jgi:hypothetical protein
MYIEHEHTLRSHSRARFRHGIRNVVKLPIKKQLHPTVASEVEHSSSRIAKQLQPDFKNTNKLAKLVYKPLRFIKRLRVQRQNNPVSNRAHALT